MWTFRRVVVVVELHCSSQHLWHCNSNSEVVLFLQQNFYNISIMSLLFQNMWLICGIPPGSVLGPLLSSFNMLPLANHYIFFCHFLSFLYLWYLDLHILIYTYIYIYRIYISEAGICLYNFHVFLSCWPFAWKRKSFFFLPETFGSYHSFCGSSIFFLHGLLSLS